MQDLRIDPEREIDYADATGIYVRAQGQDGKWGSYDIAQLDAPSLLKCLRSRGGCNRWAENVVGILLGHGHIAEIAPGMAGPIQHVADEGGPDDPS